MNIELVDTEHLDFPAVLQEAYPFLANLDVYYPDIAGWFSRSFAPGLAAGTNVLLAARSHAQGPLAGLALGKKTNGEVKIQCVRVADPGAHSGLGIALIDRMLDTLQCNKPLATVSEEMLHQYSRIFVKRYGFTLDDVAKGAYRPRKLEYYFNGVRA